jgi:hypothetical protein
VLVKKYFILAALALVLLILLSLWLVDKLLTASGRKKSLPFFDTAALPLTRPGTGLDLSYLRRSA